MKILLSLSVLAVAASATSGCFVYERRVPARTVVVEQTGVAPARETVITTLPAGYRTRMYRGTTYYYNRDVYYRSLPAGGYVVVQRPW
jgi:hypothetical protein